ncbi:MAG TPA: ABC transporter ATP-binding protein [Acidimicrobiales bacterium]|nr:ABC transporter ATP-binding protein [Acidimicrobiales bacterium]
MSLTLARRRERERPVVAGAPALRLEGIHAAYERVEVLRGVELTIAPGQVFALLGPNGAGKSTTLRVVSGRLHPVAGRVLVDGYDVTGQSPERLARAGICSVPEGRGVFPNLSVAEHLRMWTFRGGLRRSEVEDAAFGRFPRLAERRHQMAGTLSGGEQQMLAMSRALSTSPKLLLLDEISMGLAPLIVAELYEIVGQIAREGFAILLVEQFAATALAVAERAAVMIQGRIEMEGTPAEIGAAAGALYLGTDTEQ